MVGDFLQSPKVQQSMDRTVTPETLIPESEASPRLGIGEDALLVEELYPAENAPAAAAAAAYTGCQNPAAEEATSGATWRRYLSGQMRIRRRSEPRWCLKGAPQKASRSRAHGPVAIIVVKAGACGQ